MNRRWEKKRRLKKREEKIEDFFHAKREGKKSRVKENLNLQVPSRESRLHVGRCAERRREKVERKPRSSREGKGGSVGRERPSQARVRHKRTKRRRYNKGRGGAAKQKASP